MKVVIIGGGGVRTPQIVKTLYSKNHELKINKLVLMDSDLTRLKLIKTINDTILSKTEDNRKFDIEYEENAREALKDADFVLFTIRVGKIEARILDEQIPLKYGVIGQETTGPGGFAMAMRTIPVMLDYMKLIKEIAPEAWVLNLTNPSGLITQALINTGYSRVIGLCDGPSVLLGEIAEGMEISKDELWFDYFGINHLGWVKKVLHNGKDITENILNNEEALQGTKLTPELIRNLRLIPNEYLIFYYLNNKLVANLQDSNLSRGQVIKVLNEKLFSELKRVKNKELSTSPLKIYKDYNRARTDSYMKVEKEGLNSDSLVEKLWGGTKEREKEIEMSTGYGDIALEVMLGICGKQPAHIILNVCNDGAITSLEKDDIVEIPAYVNKNGIHPFNVGTIPEQAKGLLQKVKSYERLTIKAARNKSYDSALQALTMHPLVPDALIARAILDDYIRKQKDFPDLH